MSEPWRCRPGSVWGGRRKGAVGWDGAGGSSIQSTGEPGASPPWALRPGRACGRCALAPPVATSLLTRGQPRELPWKSRSRPPACVASARPGAGALFAPLAAVRPARPGCGAAHGALKNIENIGPRRSPRALGPCRSPRAFKKQAAGARPMPVAAGIKSKRDRASAVCACVRAGGAARGRAGSRGPEVESGGRCQVSPRRQQGTGADRGRGQRGGRAKKEGRPEKAETAPGQPAEGKPQPW
jgi:hypothetical protein